MPRLAVNSKCLAFHGPLLYEAKVLKVYDPELKVIKYRSASNEDAESSSLEDIPTELVNEFAYFVHYKGWKSTWDEWIREDRVLLWNEENLRTQKELRQAAFAQAPGKDNKKKASERDASRDESPRLQKRGRTGGSGGTGSSSGPGGSNGNTNTVFEDLEREEEYAKRYEIALAVPETLKALLVDDWELVTKNHKLLSLPSKLTVVDILKQYKESVNSTSKSGGKSGFLSADEDIFDEVLSGIKLYFDKALGNILLYRFERQQYLEIRKKYGDEPTSKIYGAEHLLRLFVTFPGLIAQTNMDTQSVNVLREHLEAFLRYLARHQKEIFLKDYEDVTSKYEAYSRGL